jgi:hypothetical protein
VVSRSLAGRRQPALRFEIDARLGIHHAAVRDAIGRIERLQVIGRCSEALVHLVAEAQLGREARLAAGEEKPAPAAGCKPQAGCPAASNELAHVDPYPASASGIAMAERGMGTRPVPRGNPAFAPMVRGAGDGEAVAATVADVEAEPGARECRVPDAGPEAQVGADVWVALGAELAAAAEVAVRLACVDECVGARPNGDRTKADVGAGGCDGGGGEQDRGGEHPDACQERHSCLRLRSTPPSPVVLGGDDRTAPRTCQGVFALANITTRPSTVRRRGIRQDR